MKKIPDMKCICGSPSVVLQTHRIRGGLSRSRKCQNQACGATWRTRQLPDGEEYLKPGASSRRAVQPSLEPKQPRQRHDVPFPPKTDTKMMRIGKARRSMEEIREENAAKHSRDSF